VDVQVKPFKPLDVISKRPVDGGQYQIVVDGKRVGFIGYHAGASPLLHSRYSPLELQEIEEKVRTQLSPQVVGKVGQPPLPKQQAKPATVAGDFT
jgi:hypothetical protein